MRLTPRISKSDSQNFKEYFYSKNDSFKVVGGYFAMNTPFNPQLTPLKTLFKESFALAFFRAFYKKPFRRFHLLDAQN
ncbi:hypothetical protein [Helicobacter pylori]|uniref:hypothetical protein n=1 Tax=Helicobacter pylori TaxID=210 RepID=UPI0013CDEAD0|nr:hypothetical protein [Helicobacter pylori]